MEIRIQSGQTEYTERANCDHQRDAHRKGGKNPELYAFRKSTHLVPLRFSRSAMNEKCRFMTLVYGEKIRLFMIRYCNN
ncbi:hypothetical protein OH687_24565 [Burkholderia anthina]|nr:hypothetical protein OH687_24565 [Burkholderia anthina]